jgi:hypothetical protein
MSEPTGGLEPMGTIQADQLREELRAVLTALQESRRSLAGVRAAIRPSSQETAKYDVNGPIDEATEMRAAIELALRDNLDPMIRALLAAIEKLSDSGPRAESESGAPGPTPGTGTEPG